MPTKPSRARKWVREGKAKGFFNKLGQYCVKLVEESGNQVQPLAIGIDPGKHFSGGGVQSSKFTLWTAHLQLPFQKIKERIEQRAMMRRSRRGRRINRKLPFSQRAHRQCRFNNRRGHKLPPSIRANRQLELRVILELIKVFPVTQIVYEIVEAKGDKGFSPVMVGQRWMLKQLEQFTLVTTQLGWQTSMIRNELGLVKQKQNKQEAIPATHAVDGVALASSVFRDYKRFISKNAHGYTFQGEVNITSAPFAIIKRPPISRRQLHLMLPAKGGVRRKYGGTTTRHGFRKGDYVEATKASQTFRGWVSGDTAKQVSVSDSNWKRLGQFTVSKVKLLQRSTGLICTQETNFTVAV
jgi:hypothetical protein